MKAASLLVAILCLCSCKTPPKPITVAFNGWHGRDYLKQGCIVLQREYDQFAKMDARTQAAFYSVTGKSHVSCLRPADELNIDIENQLMSAFASNTGCQGVAFSQGFHDPKTDATTESGQRWLSSEWHLSLDLTPSGDTGEVSLSNSHWTLNDKHYKSLSGSLASIEKATTDVCTIIKGQGGQI
jgi:hypothetical protein